MNYLPRDFTYTPNLPAERWALLRPVVYDLLELHHCSPSAPERTRDGIRLAAIHLSTYLDWAVDSGVDVLDASLLRMDLINAYTVLRSTEVKPHVAARERKFLLAIAGMPTERETTRKLSTTTPVSAPYDANERKRIRAWATHQPGENRLRNASVAATLCLGAGLTTRELMLARTGDITSVDELARVHVRGPRARSVVVSADWADLALALERLYSADEYLFAPGFHSRVPQAYLQAIRRTVGDLRPAPTRMRNTWLVEQMNAGTPYTDIMASAGLRSDDTLSRLWRYTDAGRAARGAKAVAA